MEIKWPSECVDRAVGLMRLGLGYIAPFPPDWEIGTSRDVTVLISKLGELFPDHDVVVGANPDQVGAIPPNVWVGSRMTFNDDGTMTTFWDIQKELRCDIVVDAMVAFAYQDGDEEQAHMVVGLPIFYGYYKQVCLVLMVWDRGKNEQRIIPA